MAARIVPGFGKSVDLSSIRFTEIGARRRRRQAILAFLTGGALFVGSAAAMVSQGALARGPGLEFFQSQSQAARAQTIRSDETYRVASRGEEASPKKHKRKAPQAASLASYSSGRAVCVRLCDGAFFPVSALAGSANVASGQATCDSQCPDAPTAVYFQPTGTDKIEDAISAGGQRYSALPVALRYRTTHDNTCTCHRDSSTAMNPVRDFTLRRGDAVMTAKGFLIFKGDERSAHSLNDFSALSKAPLAKDQRAALQAIERVSVIARADTPLKWTPPTVVAISDTRKLASDKTIRFVEASVSRAN